MALHYIDPEREPRECGDCAGDGQRGNGYPGPFFDCPDCHGTGRLGVEGAEPEILINQEPDEDLGYANWAAGPGFYWTRLCHQGGLTHYEGNPIGPFPTEAAALEAAREAVRR